MERAAPTRRPARVVPAPDPAYRGAPRMAAWRNPTMWVLALSVGLVVAGSAGYASGSWPAWVTVVAHSLAIYLGFTVLHESVHRLAHPNRAVHLTHHSKTNQPEADADFAVGQGPWWWKPFSLLSPLWEYRIKYYRGRWWKAPAELAAQLALDVAVLGVVIGAALTGHLVAVAFLAYAFDYLPHRPFDSTERFLDTRAYPSRALNVMLLGQNYHNIHHAWVSVPWFHYRPVFETARPDLEAVGARLARGAHRRPL